MFPKSHKFLPLTESPGSCHFSSFQHRQLMTPVLSSTKHLKTNQKKYQKYKNVYTGSALQHTPIAIKVFSFPSVYNRAQHINLEEWMTFIEVDS